MGWEEVAGLTVPPSTAKSIARGKEIVGADFFESGLNCVACHGEKLDGKGPAGAALDPPPTDLRAAEGYKYGNREHSIYRAVFYGVDGTGMAPLEGVLTPEQTWDVVHYVRSIQKDDTSWPSSNPTPSTDRIAKFEVPEGDYTLTIRSEGFERYTGILKVSGIRSITMSLTPIPKYWENKKAEKARQAHEARARANKLAHEARLQAEIEAKERRREERERILQNSPLELASVNFYEESGYLHYEGEVRNRSSQTLENVAVLVVFLGEEAELVTSEEALLELNPLPPGKTSPFKVLRPVRPEIISAGVEFKFLMGESINFVDLRGHNLEFLSQPDWEP